MAACGGKPAPRPRDRPEWYEILLAHILYGEHRARTRSCANPRRIRLGRQRGRGQRPWWSRGRRRPR